jgi:hypothetical protein
MKQAKKEHTHDNKVPRLQNEHLSDPLARHNDVKHERGKNEHLSDPTC